MSSVTPATEPARMTACHDRFRHNCRSAWIAGLILVPWSTALLAQTSVPAQDDAVVPVSATLCNEMKQHHVLNPAAPVGCERLRLVKFAYVGFDDQLQHNGEIVVMDAIANHVLQIFAALRDRRFPLASAKLMNTYEGDDDASMEQNNTSALNVRKVTGGGPTSLHAYGVAIDIDPVQNPYVKRSGRTVTYSPARGVDYANRKTLRSGMAETIIGVFADHGLSIWGGDWNDPTDYQHFQVSRKLAEQLAGLPATDAGARFEAHVQRYRACVKASAGRGPSNRKACAAVD